MNHKILNKLEQMIHISPQLIRNPDTLRQAIRGTFAVDVEDVEFTTIGELVDRIDDKVLDGYFRHVWQSETSKYKYSGPALIGEINKLKPRRVLDIGCGYHEFRGKIDNIIGIDPYNDAADICVKTLDYHPQERFDAVLALGSINFGSTSKIFAELEHAVSLCNPGAVLFFRANPGLPHPKDESNWIRYGGNLCPCGRYIIWIINRHHSQCWCYHWFGCSVWFYSFVWCRPLLGCYLLYGNCGRINNRRYLHRCTVGHTRSQQCGCNNGRWLSISTTRQSNICYNSRSYNINT